MPRVATAIVTFLIDIGIAVVVGLFLLLAMNGYSERAASWGLGAYALMSLGAATLAAFVVATVIQTYKARGMSTGVAVFLSGSIGVGIGTLIVVIASLIAIFIAEYARTHR